jgi:predicted ATPase/DNA-binding winged helix-turn-helix (wHTH) protein
MASDETIVFVPFRLEKKNRRLLRGDQPLALRPKAFDVLAFLAARAGLLVTKQELLDAVWPETYVSDSVLKVCVREIREALEDDPRAPRFIETAQGFGYRFLAACAGGSLPVPLTRFIGRQAEVAAVRSLVERHRLTTLTGPGGAGKTRLALEAVSASRDVSWVELAPLADPARVPEAVAVGLNLHDRHGLPMTESLVRSLRDRSLLLVLDNCEHLIHACAETARVLVEGCPRLRILATSREPLGLPGEAVWLVPPLCSDDAVALFLERGPSGPRGTEVARLCEHLDGLPLAIELAAARAKLLGVEPIVARLAHPLELLTSGSKGEASRHQTMRATIDWSYNLLTVEEARVFQRLSVFSGGCRLEHVEQVCAGDSITPERVASLLAQLVEKSLVVAKPADSTGPAHYGLLEAVRQYADERLADAGAVQARHVACFRALAERVAPRINTAERAARLAELDREHSNLLAAIEYARNLDDLESARRIAGALVWYWFHRGRWREGRRVLADLLAPAKGSSAPQWQATVLFGDGLLAWTTGEHQAARARFEASIALWRLTSDLTGLGHSLQFLAVELVGLAEPDAARQIAAESVAVFRQAEDPFGLATSLATAGIVALNRSELPEARALLEQSVEECRRIPDPWAVALPLRNLGITALRSGDLEGAVQRLRQSLQALEQWPERWFISRSLESIAIVYALRGDHTLAVELFGAGESLREGLGAAVLPFYQADYDGAMATLRAVLDATTLDQAWSRGRTMSAEEAVCRAIEG